MNLLPRSAMASAIAALSLLFPAALSQVNAQVSTRISAIVPAEARAGQPVLVTATLSRTDGIDHAVIVYRAFGESEYKRADMDIRGTSATATLPASAAVIPSLEYYIVFVLTNGTYETYPLSDSRDPFSIPPQRTMRITVQSAAEVEFTDHLPQP